MIGFTEVAKNIGELSKISVDMPKFAENTKPQYIKDTNEADKKLNANEFTYNTEGKVEVNKINCINQHLEGKEHPETGVRYERKVVDDGNGNKVEGVFPQFESKFEATLDKNEYMSSDIVQFNRANKQLKEGVLSNPDLAKQFTPQQIEMIENGRTPRGYTWHHSEELGKLQLVDTKIHDQTRHTGGKKIWGGGTENR